ncbi:hypothetical protein [Rhizobium sp. PL01]|uniref:hypothetical protein n=1 Tax=Rhizobium sp. PL01 TaxID=3085631 RepID=UPI0029823E47|nr:hypothetical protein [Rhizobium sp. PL01]MDW5312988.1 hypothetical protein [Rhizobium sp. PL01]
MIDAAKHQVSHPDRALACQEAIELHVQQVIDDATTHGWGAIETISAMEEVLRHLRLAYAEDPDPAEDPPEADSGDANDFGEFPSADGLVRAFVEDVP